MDSPVQSYSLTRRLSLCIVLATVSMWLVSLSFIYLEVKQRSEAIFDQSLAETAHSLLSIASSTIPNQAPEQTILEDANSQHYDHIVFQLWNQKGQLIYRSVGVGTQAFIHQAGFSWVKIDGKLFRAYSVWNTTKTLQVQIAQIWQIRQEMQHAIIIFLLILTVIFLPLLCWLITIIIKKNISTIHKVSEKIKKQSAGSLYPIQESLPEEIRPMVLSLNTLLVEISESMAREKRFTSNAAHELRTPLSAIRVHAQVLQHARTPEEANNAISDIILGVDKASRMISQLLTLARISPQVQQENKCLEVSALINSVLAMLDFKIQQANITIIAALEPSYIDAQPDQIEIMLRNLIDNAIIYRSTTQPAVIKVSCTVIAGKCVVRIEDNGIGIPPDKVTLIFQSFYRVNQASSVIGSGLGLSIVKQIVDLNAGKMTVSPTETGQGTTFEIQFQAMTQVYQGNAL